MEKELIEIRKKRAFELGFILYFLIMFLMAFIADNLTRMFIATTPILLSLIVLVLLIENDYLNMNIVMGLPILFGILFYTIWSSGLISELNNVSGNVLSVLNIIFTYGIFICIFFIWGNKEAFTKQNKIKPIKNKEIKENVAQKEPVQQIKIQRPLPEVDLTPYLEKISKSEKERDYYKSIVDEYKRIQKSSPKLIKEYDSTEYLHKYISELMKQIKKEEEPDNNKFDKKKKYYQQRIKSLYQELETTKRALKITKENFSVSLRSIEDKCKAINFVVGRVYSDRNGGHKEIRELLNINRLLYNTFSEMTHDLKDENITTLSYVLSLLKKKLSLFLVPEKVLFTIPKSKIGFLKRDSEGEDIVLDILASNDKDPVREYHAEATEICNNLINFLRENY